MSTVKAIFKIHSVMTSKTSKKEADIFIRNLVSNIMGDLQDQNKFTPEKLKERLINELQTLEELLRIFPFFKRSLT